MRALHVDIHNGYKKLGWGAHSSTVDQWVSYAVHQAAPDEDLRRALLCDFTHRELILPASLSRARPIRSRLREHLLQWRWRTPWRRFLLLLESSPHSFEPAPREPAGSANMMMSMPPGDMVRVPFFFGPREISGLLQHTPPGMRGTCSRFELVAAGIWRSRTAALEYAAGKEVRMSFIVNARGRAGIPLPDGFYGNAFAYSVAVAAATGELCGGDLGYALELVKKAKSAVTYGYLLSVADLMVLTGRPLFALSRTYIVSDVSHAGFKSVDFGWGEAVYGGPAKGGEGPLPGVTSYFLREQTSTAGGHVGGVREGGSATEEGIAREIDSGRMPSGRSRMPSRVAIRAG